jgi:hypothetical protein
VDTRPAQRAERVGVGGGEHCREIVVQGGELIHRSDRGRNAVVDGLRRPCIQYFERQVSGQRFGVSCHEDSDLFRVRACERRAWAQRAERVCGRCEDIAFLQRRAAGGEGKRRWEAGSAATVMRCRS